MVRDVLILSACTSGFFLGYRLLPFIYQSASQLQAGIRLQRRMNVQKDRQIHGFRELMHDVSRYILRNGFMSLRGIAQCVLENRVMYDLFAKAARLARWRQIECTEESCCSVFLVGIGMSSIVSFLLLHSVIASVCSAIVFAGGFQIAISRLEAKREEALRYQVPDAMRSLAACFHAGYSLPQAFLQTSEECQSPSKELFARVAYDVNMGHSVGEALKHFKDASGIDELGFVAVALDIQHASGGSVGPILELAEESVTRSLELRRFLRTQTAQARFSSRVVSGVPVILILLISIVSPQFMLPFFSSLSGLVVFGFAVSLQIIGVIAVRRLLKVGVDG